MSRPAAELANGYLKYRRLDESVQDLRVYFRRLKRSEETYSDL